MASVRSCASRLNVFQMLFALLEANGVSVAQRMQVGLHAMT